MARLVSLRIRCRPRLRNAAVSGDGSTAAIGTVGNQDGVCAPPARTEELLNATEGCRDTPLDRDLFQLPVCPEAKPASIRREERSDAAFRPSERPGFNPIQTAHEQPRLSPWGACAVNNRLAVR